MSLHGSQDHTPSIHVTISCYTVTHARAFTFFCCDIQAQPVRYDGEIRVVILSLNPAAVPPLRFREVSRLRLFAVVSSDWRHSELETWISLSLSRSLILDCWSASTKTFETDGQIEYLDFQVKSAN